MMIHATYNYHLALQLIIIFLFIDGMCICYMSYFRKGQEKKWEPFGVFDGILLMLITVIPVFF
jgi:hypothetical protein